MSSDPTDRKSFGHRWMSGREVRESFVDFFAEYAHQQVKSSSLVPHNDPTVLLTTAGMQQMTPYFLGLETPPAIRMTSVQKCFRTVDIEEVGDLSHCTFFFMLGNFSVGDYFKQDSLRWSWKFLTEVMGFDAERLYPTVHPDDNDAYAIWRDEIGVPQERIFRLSDNWWGPVGATGPNGPDSEIYFDLGPEAGEIGDGPGESNRFLEVWNNVFMEFFQHPDGSRTPLPKQNVDTGMGLERLTMLMQGAFSIYDTDLYQSIIEQAAALSGKIYGLDEEIDRSLRIIADHARGSTFLIGDGVLPGNEGRSYVLRRLLRRAVRNGRKIGLDRPFLAQMADVVIAQFGDEYPELKDRQAQIRKVMTHEEESFGRTLNAGLNRFQQEAAELRKGAFAKTDSANLIFPGSSAFRLYDTYGFPLDLTSDLARESGFDVDISGYEIAMATQREVSRGKEAFRDSDRDRAALYVSVGGQATEFLGYTADESDATIVALLGVEGAVETAEAGQAVEVILDRTPFYGESGGQVGDKGKIRTETGLIDIDDTFKPTPGLFVHRGSVEEGFVSVGENAHAHIDATRRKEIRRNHTATHLLHRALRMVLGDETHQAGSLVAPERLRFDFTSLEAMTGEQLMEVAEIVNEQVVASLPVKSIEMDFADAQSTGAMALFGEKYGDVVRVVSIEDYSRELCGGTHVAHTGEIGPFVIVSEGSVAAGIRRIDALTGAHAIDRLLKQQAVLEQTSQVLKSNWQELPAGATALQEKIRIAEREIVQLRGQLAANSVNDLAVRTKSAGQFNVLAQVVNAADRSELRQMADHLRDNIGKGVVVLGANIDGEPALVAMVTADAVKQGANAGQIVRDGAVAIDGRGGGRPEIAEAGGKTASGLAEAIAVSESTAIRQLTES